MLAMARSAISVVILAALLGPGTARAEKSPFEAGLRLFENHRYSDAIKQFQEAYRQTKDPAALYRIGICYEGIGDFGHAIFYYRQYLDTKPPAAERGRVEALIRRHEDEVGDLVIETKIAGLHIEVDGEYVGDTPLRPVPLMPGRYRVEARYQSAQAVIDKIEIRAGYSSPFRIEPVTGTKEDARRIVRKPAPLRTIPARSLDPFQPGSGQPRQDASKAAIGVSLTIGLLGAGAAIGSYFIFKSGGTCPSTLKCVGFE